jgi:3-oxoadipate enol-lactonase
VWDAQLESLEAEFRILRYDMRGHGRSSVPIGPYTIGALGNDVLHLLDFLGIKTAHFCGLSIGGVIGQWLAANAPRRLDRLVLSNTAAKIGTQESWSQRIAKVTRDGMADIASEIVQRWFSPAFLLTGAPVVDELRNSLEHTDPLGYAYTCAALRDMDQRELVRSIPCSVLVIAGTLDKVTTLLDAAYLVTHIDNSSLVSLKAAHISNAECPKEFNSQVIAFLNSSS